MKISTVFRVQTAETAASNAGFTAVRRPAASHRKQYLAALNNLMTASLVHLRIGLTVPHRLAD